MRRRLSAAAAIAAVLVGAGMLVATSASADDIVGTLTLGTPLTVTVTDPTATVRETFDDPVGERLRLQVTSSSLKHADGTAGSATVSTADGPLGTVTNAPITLDGDLAQFVPRSDELTIAVDGASTGTVTFVLSTVPMTTSPVTLGSATAATISTPGEIRAWSFPVTAGQKFAVTATATGLTSGSGGWPFLLVRVFDPQSGQVGSVSTTGSSDYEGVYQYVAGSSGTARILVDPYGDVTGTATFRVSALTEVTAALVPGTPVAAKGTAPGQPLVFEVPALGTSSSPAFAVSNVSVTALAGTGPTDAPVQLRQNGVDASVGQLTPQTTGWTPNPNAAYDPTQPGRLVVLPAENTTVAATVTLVQSKVSTIPIASGKPVTVRFANPGDSSVLTFTAPGGKRLALVESKVSVPRVQTEVTRSAGGPYTHLSSAPDYDEFGPALAAGGTAVTVTAPGAQSGSVVITPYLVSDPVVKIAANQDVRIAWTPGQNPQLAFSAQVGQRVVLDVTKTSVTGWKTIDAQLNRATEDVAVASFEQVAAGVRTFAELPVTLPADGAYRLRLDPSGGAAGWIEARVRVVDDVIAPLTLGRPTAVRIAQPARRARLSVRVPREAQLSWAIDGSTMASGSMWLEGPSGQLAVAPLAAGSSKGRFATGPLAAGTYTIVLDPAGWQVGTLQITVRHAPPAA